MSQVHIYFRAVTHGDFAARNSDSVATQLQIVDLYTHMRLLTAMQTRIQILKTTTGGASTVTRPFIPLSALRGCIDTKVSTH